LSTILRVTGIAPPVQVEVEPGIVMRLNPGDIVDRRILATGRWSDGVWKLIEAHLEDDSVLIDVGAHIGSMTLRAAKRVSSGTVVAVEPNPITARRLRENIAASGAENVHVEEKACGREHGTLDLYAGPSANSGATSFSKSLVMEHSSDGETKFTVEVVPLDEIVEALGLSRVDVVKIDTEGAEVQVLRGALETLERFRPVLVLETIDGHMKNLGDSLEVLEKILTEAGYVQVDQAEQDTKWISKRAGSRTEMGKTENSL